MFQLFWNVSKQNWNKLWKSAKKTGQISGVSKHWNNGLYREKTETGRKLTKSKRFSCFETFETKLKQALEKVKIPGPISGVSKHWNNGLYREKIETDWNMIKID